MSKDFKQDVGKIIKQVSKPKGCSWPEGCDRNRRALLDSCKECGAGPLCRVHIRTHFRRVHKKQSKQWGGE